MGASTLAIVLVLVASFIGAFGALLLKTGSDSFSFNPLKLLRNYRLTFGLSLYAVSSIMFIIALKQGDLTILYPLVSTTYIWTAIVSTKFLNERMNSKRWLGILAIVIGVSLIGIGG
ncbi:MAG: EamA family transporter [archaeon]